MFSGIVEEMGAIQKVEKGYAGSKLTIVASSLLEDLQVGDSVSVSGACLTVVGLEATNFLVDVSTETLHRTSLGSSGVGTPVNLERAMRLNARIGGHLVTGHVDGVGTLRSRESEGNAIHMRVEAPEDIMRYCVVKGSITLDGISLTVNEVNARSFSVMIIPHTAKVTTIGVKQAGDLVNLESDLIGKYVERLLQNNGTLPPPATPVIDKDYLQKRGLI